MGRQSFRQKMATFPFRSRLREIARKYSWGTGVHLVLRWWSCPFEAILSYVPKEGDVCDVGCGHGLLLYALSENASFSGTALGLDIDKRKISFAQGMNELPRLKFELADMNSGEVVRSVSCVVMNDVLCMAPFAAQEELIHKCYRALTSGGVLLIKEIEKKPCWKYFLTRIQEFFMTNILQFTCSQGVYFRSRNSLEKVLRSSGFVLETMSLDRGYPYPHILYVCRKE